MSTPQAAAMISPFWSMTNAIARAWLGPKGHRFPVPVISVGNIVAGGVGKTEIAASIAKHALAKGIRPVVASRGVGSSWSERGGVALDLETARTLSFPDESMVVLARSPGCAVSVGAQRTEVLKKHWEELHPGAVILDDGYQHFAIKRDLDILVHDFSVRNPILRDMPSNFSKAGARISFSDVPKMWSRLDWIRARYKIVSKLPAEALLACAIGNPRRVVRTLEEKGVKLRSTKFFRDHRAFTMDDARALVRWKESKGRDLPLLITLKDDVKFRPFRESQGGVAGFEPVVIDIELEFLENENLLWRAVDECLRLRPS